LSRGGLKVQEIGHFFICSGVHYHNLVIKIGSKHHGGSKDLATTISHDFIFIDGAWILKTEPIFEKWYPAEKVVGNFHIVRFKTLKNLPVLITKK